MNMPIQTNHLKIELDTAAVAEKYDVFKIETTEKYFSRGASILDVPQLCSNVCSVYFEYGSCFYVLMRKDGANKRRLRSALVDAEGGDKITVAEMRVTEVEQRVVASLLLNALGSYEIEFLRFNNLTGHLYCFQSKWIRRDNQKNENSILKIPCLELSITKDYRLAVAVRTFTSERLRKKIDFTTRNFEQYAKYILEANNTLRRKLTSDTEKCFILRQTQGDRTEIPFLDIQNLEKFKASKMGVVASVMSHFNEKYKGICNLSFQMIEEYEVVDSPKALVRENEQVVRSLLQEQKIRIVDMICDDYSKAFCNDVGRLLKEKYGVAAVVGKRRSKACLNLCVIHEAKFYEGKDDPHEKEYPDAAVQHITLENFMGNARAAISTIVHELLIKKDIKNGQISLYDWGASGVEEEISFGLCEKTGGADRFFFIKIKPDGSFEFEEKRFALGESSEYMDCVNVFVDSKDVAGVVRYANGDINVIRETLWHTIPEIGKIHKELAAGNTYLRGREKRGELLPSITDIKLFEEGGSQYYFVGIIGEGMRTTVNDAATIRKIEPYVGASLRFDELLPLMNVPFVRNGQLTVIPFPFKYLREYIKALKEGIE